jgi:anti-sigma regulatory factor (Ser/Thr protein kinase)
VVSADERVQLLVPAHRDILPLVNAVVQTACALVPGLSAAETYNVELAVDEAMVNIITHAYHDDPLGRVELTLEILPDRLMIQIRDWGWRIDAAALSAAGFAAAPGHEHGIQLMRQLVDSVSHDLSSQDGNCVTLIKIARRKRGGHS